MTAGNRAPISVLKDALPRPTHRHERGSGHPAREGHREKDFAHRAPPRLAASPQEVTTNTPLSKAEQPLSTTFPPPPPPAPPGCAIRERGGEAPLIPRPNAAQEGCRHARPYVSLAPAQLELPRPPARPQPPRGAPPAPRSPRSLPVRLHPSGC